MTCIRRHRPLRPIRILRASRCRILIPGKTHRDRGKWFNGLELQRDWIINQRRIDRPGRIRQIQSVDAADRGRRGLEDRTTVR